MHDPTTAHQAAILAELQAARHQQALATFAAGQRRNANLLGLFLILLNVAILFFATPLIAFTFPASLLLAIGVVIWQGITRRVHAARVAREARTPAATYPG
ncbi:MAG: hypothetical protein LW650_10725 [Planctomycetaceae bacterium]|jgi:hypothetical protein|nr:hypothetical protein [Phycisphaerales bacterium]MCE2653924.1 hypothetical protein [Planctomycetaceae bacterium]